VLRNAQVELARGLSDVELEVAERTVGAPFPPDLRAMLAIALPVGDGFPDWRDPTSSGFVDQLLWPVEGIVFDVQHNVFWHPDWPSRPPGPEAEGLARNLLRMAPPLIPVCGHRYLPAVPCLPGNPVLSAYQTDIIYYGADLVEYFENDHLKHRWQIGSRHRPLPFWQYFLDGDFE
jgi:hypothetical protein